MAAPNSLQQLHQLQESDYKSAFTSLQHRALHYYFSKLRAGIVSESASNFHQCAIHICYFHQKDATTDGHLRSSPSVAASEHDGNVNGDSDAAGDHGESLSHDVNDSVTPLVGYNLPANRLLGDDTVRSLRSDFLKKSTKLKWVCGSFSLIFAQLVTMTVVFWSALNPSCQPSNPDSCPTGHWCLEYASKRDAGKCDPCVPDWEKFCTNLKAKYPWYDEIHGDYHTWKLAYETQNTGSTGGSNANSANTAANATGNSQQQNQQQQQLYLDLDSLDYKALGYSYNFVNEAWKQSDIVTQLCPRCYALKVVDALPSGSGRFARARRYEYAHVQKENRNRVEQIRFVDGLVVFFSSIIIALACCREFRDIQLCEMKQDDAKKTIRELQDKRENRGSGRTMVYAANDSDPVYAESSNPAHVSEEKDFENFDTKFYDRIFSIVQAWRTFVLVPFLIWTASLLVVFRGRESVSVLMNTVAILIVLDFDNYVFDYGLDEKLRAYFETFDRVIIHPEIASKLDFTRRLQMVFIPMALIFGILFHLIVAQDALQILLFAIWLLLCSPLAFAIRAYYYAEKPRREIILVFCKSLYFVLWLGVSILSTAW